MALFWQIFSNTLMFNCFRQFHAPLVLCFQTIVTQSCVFFLGHKMSPNYKQLIMAITEELFVNFKNIFFSVQLSPNRNVNSPLINQKCICTFFMFACYILMKYSRTTRRNFADLIMYWQKNKVSHAKKRDYVINQLIELCSNICKRKNETIFLCKHTA